MEADQALDVVLEDPAWIYQLFPAYGGGISHFFGGIFRSKSGLLKSAVAVAVCSALLLALRRCYKKYRHHHYQHRQLLTIPTAQRTPSASQKPKARRNLRMTVVPSPLPEAKPTPSPPTADTSGRRSSSRSSRMASLKFTDSDSEDEQNPVANGRVPPKIEYTPVMDEVEAEADDESSEQEDEESATEAPDENSAENAVGSNEPAVEDKHSQDSAEVLEFSLAFETNSDSSHSVEFEPEDDHKPVTAAVNGHAIMNITDAHLANHGNRDVSEDAGQSVKSRDAAQHRKSSLEQLNSSSMENGVVVTKAIVSIG